MRYIIYGLITLVSIWIGRAQGYTEYQADVCAGIVAILLVLIDIADILDEKTE